MITIQETIDNYFSYCQAINGLSETSIKNRRIELNRFTRFCETHKVTAPDRISKNLIVGYLKYLNVNNGTKSTIVSILTAYLDYLVDEELTLDNVAASIKIKTKYPESDYLNEEEIRKVFRAEAERDHKLTERNLLIFNLLFQLCLRVSEVINLKLTDLQLDNGTPKIFLTRKGGTQVFMALNDDLVTRFQAWLDDREKFQNADTEPWVFLSIRGQQMGRKPIHLLVNQAIKRVGLIKNKMGPHILRHSGATLMSQKGAAPQEIQKLMDHASLMTTQKYLHHDREKLKETAGLLAYTMESTNFTISGDGQK